MKIRITHIWLVNGEKHEPITVDRVIDESDLNRYRRKIQALVKRKTNEDKSVAFTFKQLEQAKGQ